MDITTVILIILLVLTIIVIVIVSLYIKVIKHQSKVNALVTKCLVTQTDILQTQSKYNYTNQTNIFRAINRVSDMIIFTPDIETQDLDKLIEEYLIILQTQIQSLNKTRENDPK